MEKTVNITYEEIGCAMFLLEKKIKKLRENIKNPIYEKSLVEDFKSSLKVYTSLYLKLSDQKELDF